MWRKLCFLSFFIIFSAFFLTPAKADPILLTASLVPDLVWRDKEINVYAECYSNTSNETLSAWLQITSPISKKIDLSKDGYRFNATYSAFPYLGNYTGYLACADINSTTTHSISFRVREIFINLLNIEPFIIYPDSEWKIFVKVVERSDVEKEIKEGVEFTLHSKGQAILLKDYYYDVSASRWVLLPQPLKEGDYEIEITANYQGEIKKILTQVKINPILSIFITSVNKDVLPNQELKIGLRSEYKGNLTSLLLTSVDVQLDGEDIEIKDIADQSLTILLPDKPPGSKELKIRIGYRGYEGVVSTTLEYNLPVTGNLIAPDGKAVSGSLIFSKDGYQKRISINGPYADYVQKGTYRIEFLSADFRVILNSVVVENELKDILKVDLFGKSVKLPGLKVAGGAAIEFTEKFANAQVELRYDSRVILNEELMKVYTCNKWNFNARTCAGDWEQIQAEIDTIRDLVRFQVTHLSAFLVGEMSGLNLVFTLDKNQYFLNEPMNVNGVVRDDEGNPVEGANITYELDGSKGESFTNRDGIFTFSILSPSKEGKYLLTITASKQNYVSSTAEKSVLATPKKDLAIIFGMQQAIEAGKNYTINIKIVNSGQANLNHLRVSMSGLPSEWADYFPKEWAVLKPGEELLVTLKISAPELLEPKSYTIKVNAKADEVEKVDSFVLILQPPLPQEKEVPAVPKVPGGLFVLLPTLKSPFLIAVIVVIFALILLFKLRKRGAFPERIIRESRAILKFRKL